MAPLQYALVAYVRNDLGKFVEELRRELHPEQAHLPAHITVLPPRPLQGGESGALEIVEEVCRDVLPFEVQLGEAESFVPITPTVFIRVSRAAYKLRELHDGLNRAELAHEESWPYMPHLTIVKMNDESRARQALEITRERWARYQGPRQFLLDELTFVRQTAEGANSWVDLAPIRLGRSLAPTR
jgi:2'-5' RNA ligase